MKEYRIAKGWAIFIYIGSPLLIAVFAWVMFLPFTDPESDPSLGWVLVPVSLGMIALSILGLLDAVRGKLVIDHDRISSLGAITHKELLFSEIKGYRTADKYIFIESSNPEKKRIKVSTYYGKSDEIIVWLSLHYDDLDEVQAEEDRTAILHNEEFGTSFEQRTEKLDKARKMARALNLIGGLIFAWVLFFPKPYDYAVLISMGFPILCLAILKYQKGLIRLDEGKGSAYPTIFWATFSTTMALTVRVLLDYDIFDYSNAWTPMAVIALAYLGILATGNAQFKTRKAIGMVVTVTLFIFAWAYSAVIAVNCMYDTSTPTNFPANILDKRISSGKTTSYYLELTPWGRRTEVGEVAVSKEFYQQVRKNDAVTIVFRSGRLNIPWFSVTQ